MKHAILIMAHKDYSFLHHLIEYFCRDCYVFVHIDKKSDINTEQIACLQAMPQVTAVYQKYAVHWGGYSILKCELFLLRKALDGCDADYFHLISGQDYPIKPLDVFLDFFNRNKGTNYIIGVHLPNPRFDHNTHDRFQYIYLFDFFSDREVARHYSRKLADWQRKYHLKRRIPDYFDHLYGSSQWFSLPRETIKAVLEYTKHHPAFYKSLRFSFASEECYISTVVYNLLDAQKVKLEKSDYRYVRWKYENGNYPANLSLEHFRFLVDDKAFFARKFDGATGKQLVDAIDHYLINDSAIRFTEKGGWIYNGYQKYSFNKDVQDYLYNLCLRLNIMSVVDVGCGAGGYVAALRRLKIHAVGYDSNPFTPSLSARLLSPDDIPCSIADITEELTIEEQFDLVLSIDVLQYIPASFVDKAIDNLVKLTRKYLLIGYSETSSTVSMIAKHDLESRILQRSMMREKSAVSNSAMFYLANGIAQKFEIFILQNV